MAQEIEKTGGQAIALQADVVDREAVFAAVAATKKRFGDFNVIVNNAGVAPSSLIEDITPEVIDRFYNHRQRLLSGHCKNANVGLNRPENLRIRRETAWLCDGRIRQAHYAGSPF